MAYDRDEQQRAKLTDILSAAFQRQGWTFEKGPGFPVRGAFVTRMITGTEVVIVDLGDIVQRLLDAQ